MKNIKFLLLFLALSIGTQGAIATCNKSAYCLKKQSTTMCTDPDCTHDDEDDSPTEE